MSPNLPVSEPTERVFQSASMGVSGNFGVHVVLLALVSIHLFVCSALSVIGLGSSDIPQLPGYLWMGTIFFQPALVACWFVLSTGRFTFRLVILLILMSSFAVAHLWGASWNQGGAFSAHDLQSGFIFPGICLAVSIPLYVLRVWHWRMTNPVVDESSDRARSSRHVFTTRQLMYFIAAASIPLASFGCLMRQVTMLDSTSLVGIVARGLAFSSVMGLVSAPLLIALLGTMLATTSRSRFIIALLSILALLTAAAVGLTLLEGAARGLAVAVGETMQLAQVLVGYCGAAAVSFWVMKCSGYRLTQSTSRRGQVPTSANNLGYRSTFLLPLSVVSLLFLVLLIPSWHLVQYRRSHALEFAWRRRGVAVLAVDGQVTYARILNSGVHRDSIANDLLVDLAKALNLRHADLAGSSINDRQLESIGKALSLETLDLSQTSIGDAGIQHLVKLDKLKVLNLTGSQVSAKGIQQLKLALPDCNISGPVQKNRVTTPARTNVPGEPVE